LNDLGDLAATQAFEFEISDLREAAKARRMDQKEHETLQVEAAASEASSQAIQWEGTGMFVPILVAAMVLADMPVDEHMVVLAVAVDSSVEDVAQIAGVASGTRVCDRVNAGARENLFDDAADYISVVPRALLPARLIAAFPSCSSYVAG